ncbi:MAG: 50S ribosomal protein L22 [Candidatus Omnitrophota bacterium]|nr:MAG: 50S ribosomal protein L22 [Candidatus Omnitrophota bacterium]
MKANLRYLRISPRKVRLVADVIRGLPVAEAEAQLVSLKKRAAVPLMKLLRSAAKNAEDSRNVDKDRLYISSIAVNEGPALKRVERRARGGANILHKRMSHVSIELGVMEKKQPKYVVPEREKKGKQAPRSDGGKEKQGPEAPKREMRIPKERKGVLKRLFRRKSV